MVRFTMTIASVLLAGAFTSAAQPQQSVRITGTDYAFQIPQHIHAGETVFTFENTGSVRHEMALALVKPGFDVDSVFAALVAGSPKRNWLDGQSALIVARPADHPGPGIHLDLEAGRTYFVICTLRDAPDAQPHMMLGMIGRFRVEPAEPRPER